jgi:hypothetical protein
VQAIVKKAINPPTVEQKRMKMIEIQIDDQLLDKVNAIAASHNTTLQALVLKQLTTLAVLFKPVIDAPADEPEYDPITPLIGSLHLDTQDLGENHDRYIGKFLYREMHDDGS